MLNVIKKLLLDVVDRIDSGTSYLNAEEAAKAVELLKDYTDRDVPISKYSACRYLNVSRATFDKYIKEGKVPNGKKLVGFKELMWTKKGLNKALDK